MKHAILTALVLLGALPPARAYEAASTHAGMTERAGLYGHRLHRWLQRVHGAPLGVYEPLRLDLARVPPRERAALQAHLRALDPALGYRPSERGYDRALSWLETGSVLEDMPFSRGRHHFLDPRTGQGLHEATGNRGLSARLRTMDLLEGDGTLGGVFTGANFNLTGMSPLRWARSPDNVYRLARHLEHRHRALTAGTPAARAHHLALALLTAGALLHLLQDMAVPAHVRNDFVTTYLRRRSNILLDRASAYEEAVRKRYGRAGIPPVRGTPPRQPTFDAFFTNAKGTGLADSTQRHFYSLGSLPRPQRRIRGMRAHRIVRLVNQSQRYPFPRVEHLRISQARGGGIYYATPNNPHLFAYRITPAGRLEFTLDRECYRSAASRLVPEAVRYSAGLLAFLLRGRLSLRRKGDQIDARYDAGPALRNGEATVLWEDSRGVRRLVIHIRLEGTRPGQVLLHLPRSRIPRAARQVIVAYRGEDAAGEPLVLGARLRLARQR